MPLLLPRLCFVSHLSHGLAGLIDSPHQSGCRVERQQTHHDGGTRSQHASNCRRRLPSCSVSQADPLAQHIPPDSQPCPSAVATTAIRHALTTLALTCTLFAGTEAPRLNSGSTRSARSSPRKMIGPCCPLWPFLMAPTPCTRTFHILPYC